MLGQTFPSRRLKNQTVLWGSLESLYRLSRYRFVYIKSYAVPFATQASPRQRTGVTPISICLKAGSDEAFTSRPRPIF